MLALASSILSLVAAFQTQASQSADFSALRDTLARINDASEVRRLEITRKPQGKVAARAYAEQGWIALRLFDLTSDPADSKRAVRAFEEAVDLDSLSGWAQYGLGLSLASSPEARWLGEGGNKGRVVLDDAIRKLMGVDPRSRARRAYNAALHATPPVRAAARDLGRLALVTWKQESLVEARDALLAVIASGPHGPDVLLTLAEVQAALGEGVAAAGLADRAIAQIGANGSTLRIAALAHLRTPGGAEAGARRYFDGIASASAAELEQYFKDVELILTPDERWRWNYGDLQKRRDLMRTLWNTRAALGGMTAAERVAEHYRRLAYAEQHLRRHREAGAPTLNNLRWESALKWSRFDDRGEIFLRHGDPQRVIRGPIDPRNPPNETWVYLRGGEIPRMFHFVYQEGDYTLPYRLPCGHEYWGFRAEFDPRGNQYMARCNILDNMAYSAEANRAVFGALSSDTHYPAFTRDLPFLYDLYTFRGDAGKTTVVAAFAVPASALEKTAVDGGVRYRFDLSLILADTASGSVSRTDDSASIKLPRSLSGDDMLRAHLEVQVPPSKSMLQRVIVTDPTEPGIGQLYGGPFQIPDYSGQRLMISDIALGFMDPVRGWRRRGIGLALVPTNLFKGGEFSLYYEIYNLPAGAKYTTELVIEQIDRSTAAKIRDLFGGEGAVKMRFEGESTPAPDGVVAEPRKIGAPLRKGRYRLTVTVKDLASGQTAKASRQFTIPG